MDTSLTQLAEILSKRGLTVATAESCTGGLVGHWITELSGSSNYYLGGVQAYSNDIKAQVLGVAQSVLETEGAVSEACARAMAEGARSLVKSDLAVSITGIAGPGGGTVEKPTGLVFCAVAGASGTIVSRNVWTGNRSENKQASAQEAIRLLLLYLKND